MKKKIIFMILGLLLIFIVLWFKNHSTIKITVSPNTANAEIVYKFINQSNQKVTEIKSTSNTIKKILPRGNYEIWVSANNSSYFTVVESKRFLGQTAVEAKTQTEKVRKFVGDNPDSCMDYINKILLSYACNSSFNSINIHMPATAVQPTYVVKNEATADIFGDTEGIINTPSGSLALVHASAESEIGGQPHFIYKLVMANQRLKQTNGVRLSALDENKTYNIKPYRDGFIVYDSNLEKVFFFSSISANPQTILIKDSDAPDLQPLSLNIIGESIVILYGKGLDSDSKKQSSEVVVVADDKTSHYKFDKDYFSATLCGTDKICALSSKTLDVYSNEEPKAKFLYKLTNVATNMVNTEAGLLLTNKQAVINFDADKRQGFAEYSLGNYIFNNIVPLNGRSSYLLNLTDAKNRKIALLVEQKNSNEDNIDKKVQELLKLPEILNISVYDKYIFITPDAGDVVYVSSRNAYGYDPSKLQSATDKINKEINALNINRDKYKINIIGAQ